MKNTWVIVGVIVLVLIAGYLGRHKIKSMFGGSSAQTPAQTETMTPSSSPSDTASSSANMITSTKQGPKGAYLTDAKGMTLYTYDKDTKGVSNCYNGCAKAWPPFTVSSPAPSSTPSGVDTIKRTDGSMQYTYNGMPLYYYVSDTKPGDITGDGVGGVWHIVKP